MKKKSILFLLALTVGIMAIGCGKKEEPASSNDTFVADEDEEEKEEEAPVAEEETPVVEEETREGMYRSELTNEWIDESLKDQRPIAVMIDNEKTALPHYGMNSADVVYEMMNSTKNGHVTRFMALYKDYDSVKQIGSVRSVRPTNLRLPRSGMPSFVMTAARSTSMHIWRTPMLTTSVERSPVWIMANPGNLQSTS